MANSRIQSSSQYHPHTRSRIFNSASVKAGVFLAFLLCVLFMGGASRPDVLSLLALRPLAFIFLGYACLVITRQELSAVRGPLVLLGCLAGWMAIQLVPLPPAIWSSLPQRDIIFAVSKDLDLQNLWRPISLVPSRTLNSLMALSVPAAAVMLFAILDDSARRKVPLAIIAMGILSMVLGLLQIAGPAEGPLYIYKQTNNGVMVGFFANRNHHAVFLACLIPLTAGILFDRLSKHKASKSDQNVLYIAMSMAMIVFVLPYILITGSRAGALLAIVGLLMSALMWALWLINAKRQLTQNESLNGKKALKRATFLKKIMLVPIVATVILLGVAAAVYLDRDFALNRYQQLSDVEELRVQTLPVIAQMAKSHFAIGAGFGSFEWLYKMWEPDALLMPSYLNQAHNDGLQWVIEGGIPAIAILFGLFWMLYMRGAKLVGDVRAGGRIRYIKAAALCLILIILAASLADYPLRTPIMMAFLAIIICQFYIQTPRTPDQQVRPDL
jgi:O-Antigen ligase